MFPNPHDALPLPPRPNLNQYKTLAKDLLKAARSADPNAIGTWAAIGSFIIPSFRSHGGGLCIPIW